MYLSSLLVIFSKRFGCTSCGTNQRCLPSSNCGKVEVENQTGKKVKCLKTDNGIKYTNDKFRDFCEQYGIKRHFTVHKTSQQNGVAERMNWYISESARCLRLNSGLAKFFWVDAVSMTCYLINRLSMATLDEKVAEEV
jgi:hypothetical protein